MSTEAPLDPEVADSARLLLGTSRICAESDPDRYRTAVKGKAELTGFFRNELGWHVEFLEAGEQVRLHKRRGDVPSDRGPRLERSGSKGGPLAPARVLMLVALTCEQLWRRPRMSVQDLLHALAQVCAEETAAGALPQFKVVFADDTAKEEAKRNRQNLLDALKILKREGTITVDADLDRATPDRDGELVVIGSRDRLAAKFSSLSPALLGLDGLPPDQHVAALSAETLPDMTADDDQETTATERRLRVIRRLVDDPACDPLDDPSAATPYLHTLTGREKGLSVLAALGLPAAVRRDWWEVTDPSGLATTITFPNERRGEHQAALKILAHLTGADRPDPTAPIGIVELVGLFEQVRQQLPKWAAGYGPRLPALARAAAVELSSVGLLRSDPTHPDQWLPTPGVALWRVRARAPQPADGTENPPQPAAEAVPLFDDPNAEDPSPGDHATAAPAPPHQT